MEVAKEKGDIEDSNETSDLREGLQKVLRISVILNHVVIEKELNLSDTLFADLRDDKFVIDRKRVFLVIYCWLAVYP